MRRVVVTGIGAVTPLASGAQNTWQKLLAGQSGIKNIDTFDVSDIPAKIAGLVPRGQGDGLFNAEDHVSVKDMKKMDDFIVYVLLRPIRLLPIPVGNPKPTKIRKILVF